MRGAARWMKGAAPAAASCAAIAAAGCGGDGNGSSTAAEEARPKGEPAVELPAGKPPKKLVVRDLKVGGGQEVERGDELVTRFVAEYVTGERFESTWEPGRKPFGFVLGAEEASPGWERGLRGMRVGGRRYLIVPPRLSSQDRTATEGGPETTLVYVIDLVAAKGPAEREEPTLEAPVGAPSRKLRKRDLVVGTGRTARQGDELTVEYIGVRYDGFEVGNSWKRSKPFRFTLGTYHPFVSPGWQRGIRGMRVGGRRELSVPPRLLYTTGAPPDSTPEETTLYVIDLIAVR